MMNSLLYNVFQSQQIHVFVGLLRLCANEMFMLKDFMKCKLS